MNKLEHTPSFRRYEYQNRRPFSDLRREMGDSIDLSITGVMWGKRQCSICSEEISFCGSMSEIRRPHNIECLKCEGKIRFFVRSRSGGEVWEKIIYAHESQSALILWAESMEDSMKASVREDGRAILQISRSHNYEEHALYGGLFRRGVVASGIPGYQKLSFSKADEGVRVVGAQYGSPPEIMPYCGPVIPEKLRRSK